jgi:hypothetical protein
MYAVIHLPSQTVSMHNGLHDEKRKAKLSMRNNTFKAYQHEYGVAEVDVVIKSETIEQVNPQTKKWEKVNS